MAILYRLGTIFYYKINQPQHIMYLKIVSLYGHTLNPYNINLLAGGSSRGEGALITL
jgi:amidase